MTFIGLLLIQIAWIAVLPPYGAIDEHEHVFKATAVAHGDFKAHHTPSRQGWGEFVTVPESIARAAQPQCDILGYTHSDNCIGTDNGDGTVRIASSAARYNPVYYAVVGTLARPFGGDVALYVMRVITALLCSLLIAAAFTVVQSWARTRWPAVTLLLALTPTALYSTTVVAPNGVEIGGGVLLWACLVGLRARRGDRASSAGLLGLATLASAPLLAVRAFGPVWWALIVSVCLLLLGTRHARGLVRAQSCWIFLIVSGACGLVGVGWSAIARPNGFVLQAQTPGSPWPDMWSQWMLWFFQTIAAAPLRNEYVPIVVYAIALTLIGLTTCLALLSATWRERLALLLIVVIASAVAIAATVMTYSSMSYAWQGRYLLPFTSGFFVVVGAILDRGRRSLPVSLPFVAVMFGLAVAATQGISQLAVLRRGVRTSPLVETGAWHVPPDMLVLGLSGAGSLLLVVAALSLPRPDLGRQGSRAEVASFATIRP